MVAQISIVVTRKILAHSLHPGPGPELDNIGTFILADLIMLRVGGEECILVSAASSEPGQSEARILVT